ncbi:MAG: putative two-component system sensor kinase [Nocardioides sp.]|jgi:signal transduction histidine kinase|uniref:sensor histidine kinase n=1 Tax=Nocardioides sp. TaxID=35761 RepID=UPI0026149B61|nr:HAMP domain-containing sensor histidine kinase [Nocardioides sp.]MCW2833163.1 putative two-component system sensor kinase [Nocardioides sp.]
MAFTLDDSRWVGHTSRAARQAGILFLLAAGLSLLAIISFPDRREPLLLLAGLELVIAVLALLPWRHLGPVSMTAIALVAWTVIGASTWAVGGIGSGSGAFFVLAFAWMGLHLSRRMILLNAPLAACAYTVALVFNDVTREVLAATVLVIPFALSIGLVIEGRVRRLSAARQIIEDEQSWRAALMATLAHDVRSPLTTIQGVLELLTEDAELPAHLEPLVAAAARQTARLTILASSLLDLERVEGGKLVLDLQQVDVDALMQQVAELLDDASIRVEVEAGLTARADPVRLQQMLVNLGTNALRHGQPPVVMGARMADGMVELVVRDYGLGVATADRPHLFERLNRTTDNPESVGLGLWIVRLLARAHGGDATHRPADVGSEFVITLPRARSGEGETPARTESSKVPANTPT